MSKQVSVQNSQYIIAVDLDETLLNSQRQVTKYALDVLNDFKKRGFILAISSTRGYGSCKQIAKQINADYVCCQSGNMIVDQSGNVIYKNGFSKSEVSQLIDTFKMFTDEFFIDSDENLYGGKNDDFAKRWGAVHCKIEDLPNMNAYKICVGYKPHYVDKIQEYRQAKGYVCREMRTDPLMLITPANSDKFYALEKLIDILNTDLNHLIVFGDDNSDTLSIQKAKYGVAMQNARPEVLSQAKFVAKSNEQDGVAHFLQDTFGL